MSSINREIAATTQCAVIYARVSSAAQTKRGDGLGSQETRCREFARMKDYTVRKIFKDDISGGSATRPGMQAMLDFLCQHRKENPVVIIDDVSRLARGLEAHLQLRSQIGDAGGRLESPSIEFGEDSDSILIENLLASVSQHQRQKNAEQTKNRMRARAMNGYWCFQAPIGYKYQQAHGHGKILVRDEPCASILQEALEGFASGHFQTQVEVKRFLESRPDYPKSTKDGEIRHQQVADILTRPIYAGMVEVPNWNISMRRGHHEGLISFETFTRIQEALRQGAKAPMRKDISADFPLRGAVMCGDCDNPLTACWSTGNTRKHPYYLCHTKGCKSYRKSIRRDKIEEEFVAMLSGITPTRPLFHLLKALFHDLWNQRLTQKETIEEALRKDAAELEKKLENLLDRIVDATSPTVIAAYEKRIAAFESEKLIIEEKLNSSTGETGTCEELFERALQFLSNPLQLWNSDKLEDKKTVLKLTFANRLAYCREKGFRIPELSIPFKLLGAVSSADKAMARPAELSSNELFNTLADWEYQLHQLNSPQSTNDKAA